jgi:hypothetical protein
MFSEQLLQKIKKFNTSINRVNTVMIGLVILIISTIFLTIYIFSKPQGLIYFVVFSVLALIVLTIKYFKAPQNSFYIVRGTVLDLKETYAPSTVSSATSTVYEIEFNIENMYEVYSNLRVETKNVVGRNWFEAHSRIFYKLQQNNSGDFVLDLNKKVFATLQECQNQNSNDLKIGLQSKKTLIIILGFVESIALFVLGLGIFGIVG